MAPMLIGIAGVALGLAILWDAIETVLVPRRIGRRIRLTRYFYVVTWYVWRAIARAIQKPSRREALLGFYGPLSLILLLVCWATGLIVAYALMHLAATAHEGLNLERFRTMLYLSGETFFTLGFGDITPTTELTRWLSVLEAGMGFAFLGTVVGYLPTMYSSFSQREIEISLLDARAGSPPTAAECLSRMPAFGERALSEDILRGWERWSAQLLETHISYPQLAYYRSQHSNQSWLGALTAILDSSALILARREAQSAHQAQLTFAMARHALVDITHIFVPRFRPGAADRLTAEELRRLRAHLSGTPVSLPASEEFEKLLTELRRLYEPYAQVLAQHLLIELPPWIHAKTRPDNWRGGPWDRMLSARAAAALPGDEHF